VFFLVLFSVGGVFVIIAVALVIVFGGVIVIVLDVIIDVVMVLFIIFAFLVFVVAIAVMAFVVALVALVCFVGGILADTSFYIVVAIVLIGFDIFFVIFLCSYSFYYSA
jgi:hypothetical protein